MLVQVRSGERGFIFHTDNDVILFVAIDAPADASGARNLPLNRVEFGVRDQVETIPALSGYCRFVDPQATWRAETVCEAGTLKGRFAAQFATIDGAVEPAPPNETGR